VHKYCTFCCTIRYFLNLKQNTTSTPLEPSHNLKSCQAIIQRDACGDTNPTSVEDTANESCDLPDLDTEDEEVLEEGVTGEEEEEKEEEGNEEDGKEERNEEDEPVSNDDMEHSLLVVASGRPTGIGL